MRHVIIFHVYWLGGGGGDCALEKEFSFRCEVASQKMREELYGWSEEDMHWGVCFTAVEDVKI